MILELSLLLCTMLADASINKNAIHESISIGTTNFFFCTSSNHCEFVRLNRGNDNLSLIMIELVENANGKRHLIGEINNVWDAKIIQNSYTGDGFILACQHGPEKGEVGCNMLYYVDNAEHGICIKSFKDILANCNFDSRNGVNGVVWGAYYVGESTNDMAVMIKVGYGLGTNQLYKVGMCKFSGELTRKIRQWPCVLISDRVPNYERESKDFSTRFYSFFLKQ